MHGIIALMLLESVFDKDNMARVCASELQNKKREKSQQACSIQELGALLPQYTQIRYTSGRRCLLWHDRHQSTHTRYLLR
eukprot:SAG31_NODE_1008_length_10407_cov_2.369131_13_plen_80_part_00